MDRQGGQGRQSADRRNPRRWRFARLSDRRPARSPGTPDRSGAERQVWLRFGALGRPGRYRRRGRALGARQCPRQTRYWRVSGRRWCPGGPKQTRQVARELAARTGRPSIYNLMSDPIGNPDEWVEHLKWLEEGFKSGARCYGSCLSTVAGGIFNLERGLNVPQ